MTVVAEVEKILKQAEVKKERTVAKKVKKLAEAEITLSKLRRDSEAQSKRIDAALKTVAEMGTALELCVEILGELAEWAETNKLMVPQRTELEQIMNKMKGVFKTYVKIRT